MRCRLLNTCTLNTRKHSPWSGIIGYEPALQILLSIFSMDFTIPTAPYPYLFVDVIGSAILVEFVMERAYRTMRRYQKQVRV